MFKRDAGNFQIQTGYKVDSLKQIKIEIYPDYKTHSSVIKILS